MSIEDTKRSKRAAAQHLAEAEATAKAKAAPRQRPVVGAYAQVSLLPREMLLKVDRRACVRRSLIAGVIVTAVVVAGGVAGSAVTRRRLPLPASPQQNAAGEAARPADRASTRAVQELQAPLALDKAAARVGSSTAINWDPADRPHRRRHMPAGYDVTAITTDSASPIQDYRRAPRRSTSPAGRVGDDHRQDHVDRRAAAVDLHGRSPCPRSPTRLPPSTPPALPSTRWSSRST